MDSCVCWSNTPPHIATLLHCYIATLLHCVCWSNTPPVQPHCRAHCSYTVCITHWYKWTLKFTAPHLLVTIHHHNRVLLQSICITFYSIHWVSALQTVGDVCTVGYRTGYWTNGGAGGTNLFRGRRVVVNSPYLPTTTLVNTLFGAHTVNVVSSSHGPILNQLW